MEQIERSETSAYNSDAGELPKTKHSIFRTRRKFEIKNCNLILYIEVWVNKDIVLVFKPFAVF